ncbi:hypothetical protein P3S68_010303 [Capsicum galapagoense]
MFVSCLSCIPRKHCKFLPDDVLLDIFCRLPTEDIICCKQVCRQWHCLISMPQFINIHVNCGAAVPTIVCEFYNTSLPTIIYEIMSEFYKIIAKTKIVFLDDWIKKRQGILTRKKRIRRSYTCKLLNSSARKFSYHGLLLYRHYNLKRHLILNPITREQVTFDIPSGTIVALFFHPIAKEYYAICTRYLEKLIIQQFKSFKLTSLLSNEVDILTGWKRLHYRVPTFSQSHIVKRDAVYWMAEENSLNSTAVPCEELVIIFDIIREEFRVVSHPGDKCDSQVLIERHAQMHLLEKEGLVSFCMITIHNEHRVKMQFWTMEDQHVWSQSSQTIILEDMSVQRFPMRYPHRKNFEVKPVGTLNGELIISWLWRGVFAYHLQLRALRKLEFEGMEGSHALIHNNKSLSLRNLLQSSKSM